MTPVRRIQSYNMIDGTFSGSGTGVSPVGSCAGVSPAGPWDGHESQWRVFLVNGNRKNTPHGILADIFSDR